MDFLENNVEMGDVAKVKNTGCEQANHRTSAFSSELELLLLLYVLVYLVIPKWPPCAFCWLTPPSCIALGLDQLESIRRMHPWPCDRMKDGQVTFSLGQSSDRCHLSSFRVMVQMAVGDQVT